MNLWGGVPAPDIQVQLDFYTENRFRFLLHTVRMVTIDRTIPEEKARLFQKQARHQIDRAKKNPAATKNRESFQIGHRVANATLYVV